MTTLLRKTEAQNRVMPNFSRETSKTQQSLSKPHEQLGLSSGLQTVAEMLTDSVRDESNYTVTLTHVLNDNSLKHRWVLITPNAWEAVERQNELNSDRPFFGSKKAAQVIRRENGPRRWKLLAQVSTSEVHIRCEWSHARALLRSSNIKLLKRLIRGHTISSTAAVCLQSEQVELTLKFYSDRSVKFTKAGSPPLVTQAIKVCTPVVGYFDVNENSQLTVDTGSGAVARYAFEDDTLVLPKPLATVLWEAGMVLPLKSQENGAVVVRMMDPELRTRLALSYLKRNWFDKPFWKNDS